MLMANLMLVYDRLFWICNWLIFKYGANAGLYTAATKHGRDIDELLMFNCG